MKTVDDNQVKGAWGGKRANAGRKASSLKGQNLWIPAECLLEVKAILESYSDRKTGEMLKHIMGEDFHTKSLVSEGALNKDDSTFTLPLPLTDFVPETTLETVPETTLETVPETTLETVPETTLETVPYGLDLKPIKRGVKATDLKQLQRLPKEVQRKLIRDFGGLSFALKRGVWIEGKKAFIYRED